MADGSTDRRLGYATDLSALTGPKRGSTTGPSPLDGACYPWSMCDEVVRRRFGTVLFLDHCAVAFICAGP